MMVFAADYEASLNAVSWDRDRADSVNPYCSRIIAGASGSAHTFRRGMIVSTKQLRWIAIGILVITLGWAAKFYFFPSAYGHWWTPVGFSYLRGYRLGIAQAKKDISDSNAMVLDISDATEEHVDRSTGLRVWYMGDVTDRGTDGYVAGYNATIHAYIEKHGIPPYSWKPWEGVVFNAAAYFDRDQPLKPEILRNRSTGITHPDSNTLVTLKTNATGDIYLICFGLNSNNCETAWPVAPVNGELKCKWGPKGSNLLFIRGLYCRTNMPVTGVLDVSRGLELRFDYIR
jgi:hypothetical protein